MCEYNIVKPHPIRPVMNSREPLIPVKVNIVNWWSVYRFQWMCEYNIVMSSLIQSDGHE